MKAVILAYFYFNFRKEVGRYTKPLPSNRTLISLTSPFSGYQRFVYPPKNNDYFGCGVQYRIFHPTINVNRIVPSFYLRS